MSIKDMTKEDLELLSYKDITNLLLKEEGPKNTPDLFKKIVDLLELNDGFYESKIGDYYMMLTTDKRFILLGDGNWDLRERHTSDKIVTIEEDEDDTDIDEGNIKVKDEEELDDDYDLSQEDDYDDSDDDLKDLVVLDEDELDLDE